jgi:dihydrodipicolinate synthase/N-acetylneuraminate lyase
MLGSLSSFCVKDGVSGLVVCGSVGENTSLSTDEKLQIIEVAKDAAGGKIPVIGVDQRRHHHDPVDADALRLFRHFLGKGGGELGHPGDDRNFAATHAVMKNLVKDGVSGLVVCGSVGENTSLSTDEKLRSRPAPASP